MADDGYQRAYPTLRSILQPDALVETVRAAYGLEVTGGALLKPQLSDVYRIDSRSGPFILRVYPHGLNLARWIEAEVEILNALLAEGVPVAAPLPLAKPLATGNWLLPLDAPEGERYGVLFRYARGWSLKRARDPRLYRAFGQVAARMHRLSGVLPAGARVPLDAYTLLTRPLEIIALAYPEQESALEELHEAAHLAQQAFELLPARAWGFCHGSLNFSNVHAAPDGALTLFHFEYCGPGWPAYDVATVLNFESPDAARHFMEGYEGERPLLPAERAALGWFQVANRLWMLGAAASLSSVFGSLLTSSLLLEQALEFVRERVDGLVAP